MLSKYKPIEMLFTFLILVSMALSVRAAETSCGTSEWMATSTQTTACIHGSGNPDEGTVGAQFSSPEQVDKVTEIEDGRVTQGSSELFNVTLSSGFSWGNIPNGGTWTIDNLFWNTYESAAISIKGGTEYAIFIVEPGSNQIDLTGIWSIDGPAGTGGGLSNIKLWGVNRVPEPSVLALFSIGFAGLVYIRRKRTK